MNMKQHIVNSVRADTFKFFVKCTTITVKESLAIKFLFSGFLQQCSYNMYNIYVWM